VNPECEKLDSKKAQVFHHLVAKTLYTTERARPDTSTAIAFLTTRVREPDTDDWKKLCHLMRYLSERHQISTFALECQWQWHCQVVCGRVVWHPPSRPSRAYWGWFIHGDRISHCDFHKFPTERKIAWFHSMMFLGGSYHDRDNPHMWGRGLTWYATSIDDNCKL
jgi:hypothetical protein